MYAIKTPKLIQAYYKDYVWKIPSTKKVLYLTFDDGPVDGVTDKVLDILDSFGAKATFFCIGKNAIASPKLLKRIQKEEHVLGNHTFNHLNGWKTGNISYLKNILLPGNVISSLFRPPYGKITKTQANALNTRYKVIMWDVLSGDFDQKNSFYQCAINVNTNAEPGSIIVFHDSLKAKENVLGALPIVLKHFKNQGFEFSALPFSL